MAAGDVWQSAAGEAADAMERAAAKAWAERRESGRAAAYHTSRGLIRAEAKRDAQTQIVRITWRGESRELCRAEAVALIAERMESRLS